MGEAMLTRRFSPISPGTLFIYDHGQEFPHITGGWLALVGWNGGFPTVIEKRSSSVFMQTGGNSGGDYSAVQFITSAKLDITKYRFLKAFVSFTSTQMGQFRGIIRLEVKNSTNHFDPPVATASKAENFTGVLELDISNIVGSYHLQVYQGHAGIGTLYRVWLEE